MSVKIFRDDDISVTTATEKFIFVHEIFQKFKVTHTLALIMKDIEKNESLVKYINDHKDEFDLQLHCYEHFDHGKADYSDVTESLNNGISTMKIVFGITPTLWFPPWNSTSETANKAAAIFNLTARPDKITLDQYIRKNGGVKEDVINFHYWYEPEVNDLYKALSIYNKLKR